MGAPVGNTNATKNKPYYDALRRVLAQLEVKDENGKVIIPAGEALRAIAEKQALQALTGDTQAQKEIADRLDGKPAQQIQMTGEDGGAVQTDLTVRFVGSAEKP